MVGARDLALGQLVQAKGEPLGQATVIDEHDRRAVFLDELEERRVDRRPDRAALPRLAHILERDDDPEIELLARARVDELDRAPSRDEPPDLLERPLGGRETDALHRAADEALEPLQAQREVGAALRAGNRMHFVDDDDPNVRKRLAGARGEHEKQRLRRRDQDVRGPLQHRGSLLRRRVPRADGDRELGADAGERSAQVSLDVVVQRLQRADVEHLRALARPRPVERPHERRERLSGARRRLDEHVASRGDGRPASLLGGSRPVERPLEPLANARAEGGERAHESSVPPGRQAAGIGDRIAGWTSGHPSPPPAFEPNAGVRACGARSAPRSLRGVTRA